MRNAIIFCMAVSCAFAHGGEPPLPEAEYSLDITVIFVEGKAFIKEVDPGSPMLNMRSTIDNDVAQIDVGDALLMMDGMELRTHRDFRFGLNRTSLKQDGAVRLRIKDTKTNQVGDWWVNPRRLKPDAPEPKRKTHSNIKVLLLGLTDDESIGESVDRDLDTMTKQFLRVVERRHVYELKGDDMETDLILAKLERMKIDPDDALICYISGHGAYDGTDAGDPSSGNHFTSATDKRIYRRNIWAAMQKKGARLSVLISDTCNVKVDVEVPRSYETSTATGDPDYFLRHLFLDFKGSIDISGASQNQLGWCYASGGLFTMELDKALSNKTWEPDEGWRELLARVSQGTNKSYRLMRDADMKAGRAGRAMINQPDQIPQTFVFDVSPK